MREMTHRNGYRKLKIGIDIFSISAVCMLLVVIPIWAHYSPDNGREANGQLTPVIKALLWDLVPAIVGINWLIFRYAPTCAAKYPFTLSTKFRVLVIVVGVPFILLMKTLASHYLP